MAEFPDRIDDEEVLFRRVPASTGWYRGDQAPPLEPEAFRPNRNDVTGISLSRAISTTVEEAAKGRPGKSYYVAVLRAGDLRATGMQVVPRPVEGNPGHAEIANLTYDERKSRRAIEWQFLLAHKLCRGIQGPYRTEES